MDFLARDTLPEDLFETRTGLLNASMVNLVHVLSEQAVKEHLAAAIEEYEQAHLREDVPAMVFWKKRIKLLRDRPEDALKSKDLAALYDHFRKGMILYMTDFGIAHTWQKTNGRINDRKKLAQTAAVHFRAPMGRLTLRNRYEETVTELNPVISLEFREIRSGMMHALKSL